MPPGMMKGYARCQGSGVKRTTGFVPPVIVTRYVVLGGMVMMALEMPRLAGRLIMSGLCIGLEGFWFATAWRLVGDGHHAEGVTAMR